MFSPYMLTPITPLRGAAMGKPLEYPATGRAVEQQVIAALFVTAVTGVDGNQLKAMLLC